MAKQPNISFNFLSIILDGIVFWPLVAAVIFGTLFLASIYYPKN